MGDLQRKRARGVEGGLSRRFHVAGEEEDDLPVAEGQDDGVVVARAPGRARRRRRAEHLHVDTVPVRFEPARDRAARDARLLDGRRELVVRAVVPRRDAFPHLAHVERAQEERHAADVIRMGVREDEPAEDGSAVAPEIGTEHRLPHVEARIERTAGIDHPGAAPGRANHDRIGLPDVEERHVKPAVQRPGSPAADEAQRARGPEKEPAPLSAGEGGQPRDGH